MRLVLALLAFLLPGAAFAACDPPNATKGTPGCMTVAPSVAGSDYVQMWLPGAFPDSWQIVPVDTLFQGRGGGNIDLTSPGPIGSTTPNTIAGTQMAANSLVIGSPAGGNMGAGTLNLVSLFIDGVSFGGGLRTQPKVTTTIAVGDTFQKILDLDTSRKSCFISNDNTHVMYVFQVGVGETGVTTPGTGTATEAKSVRVAPSGSFTCAGVQDEIDVTTSTPGDVVTPVYTH